MAAAALGDPLHIQWEGELLFSCCKYCPPKLPPSIVIGRVQLLYPSSLE